MSKPGAKMRSRFLAYGFDALERPPDIRARFNPSAISSGRTGRASQTPAALSAITEGWRPTSTRATTNSTTSSTDGSQNRSPGESGSED